MRFNDLTATVLAVRPDTPGAKAILWRQCVDLLAQVDHGDPDPADGTAADELAARLVALRGEVPVAVRLASIRELGAKLRSERLARLFLDDESTVVVAAMRAIRLDDSELARLIAEAGPLARSILRGRTDIGPLARRALDAFGATDLSLARTEVAETVTSAPETEASQIRRIVERIERFTQERRPRATTATVVDATVEEATPRGSEDVVAPAATSSRFTFVTDVNGTLIDADGGARSALVGLSLCRNASDGSGGVDGQVFGAFHKKTAIRDGRLIIPTGPLAGTWLINADARFDPASGRFLGYAGDGRAPDAVEQAARLAAAPTMAGGTTATSLRQLIHELRTPLTGMMGFAELIQTELLGPVPDGYRTLAGDIVSDVRSLVDILDDLDSAHRQERKPHVRDEASGADLAASLEGAIARYAPGDKGSSRLLLNAASDLPRAALAGTVADRIALHLIRAVAACLNGESRAIICAREGRTLVVSVARPSLLRGLDEAALLDPGFDHAPEGEVAPPLGIGFTLRLVNRLAQANGGSFTISRAAMRLTLPVFEESSEEAGRQS